MQIGTNMYPYILYKSLRRNGGDLEFGYVAEDSSLYYKKNIKNKHQIINCLGNTCTNKKKSIDCVVYKHFTIEHQQMIKKKYLETQELLKYPEYRKKLINQ